MVRYLKSSRATKSFCCARRSLAEESRATSAPTKCSGESSKSASRSGPRERGERAIRKAAEERLRQQLEAEQIDRQKDRRRRRDSPRVPKRATNSCVASVIAKMFIRFVTMSTVTSSRSGCASRRLSTIAARSRSFSRCLQPHAIHREHARLDARENERDEKQQATANQIMSSSSVLRLRGASCTISTSSMRLREVRRTVSVSAVDLHLRAGLGQRAEAVENEAADRVDALLLELACRAFR